MQFTQKIPFGYTKTRFEFKDDGLHYMVNGESADYGFVTRYSSIAADSTLETHMEQWPLYLAISIWGACVLERIADKFSRHPETSGYSLALLFTMLAISAVLGMLYKWIFRSDSLCFRCDKGQIIILADENQKLIAEEISARRKADIKRKFAEVDPLGDPAQELAKLKHFREEGILSDEEYSALSARLSWDGNMEFHQKRNGYKTSLTFGADKLEYLTDVNYIKSGGSIPYERIAATPIYKRVHRYWQVKYIASFFFVMGMFLAIFGLRHGINNSLCILAAFTGLSALLIACSFFSKAPMLTLLAAEPTIVILHDEQHDAIMEEIAKRRIASLRRKYMELDFLNNPADESARMRFLLNEGAISDKEYREAISRLLTSRMKPSNSVS